jgi:hypothetical protein
MRASAAACRSAISRTISCCDGMSADASSDSGAATAGSTMAADEKASSFGSMSMGISFDAGDHGAGPGPSASHPRAPRTASMLTH